MKHVRRVLSRPTWTENKSQVSTERRRRVAMDIVTNGSENVLQSRTDRGHRESKGPLCSPAQGPASNPPPFPQLYPHHPVISTLSTETTSTSETLVTMYKPIRHDIPIIPIVTVMGTWHYFLIMS
jgi:hypothetical protein